MWAPETRPPLLRFGAFELDRQSGELRRNGMKIRLADQPFQILELLVDRPGELVTREQLRERLWSTDTYVDFDLGLYSAIRRLREALDDSADNPRFVQTLPRRGYRFIGPVTPAASNHTELQAADFTATRGWRIGRGWITVCLVLLLAIAALGIAYKRGWDRSRGGDRRRPHAAEVRAVNPEAYEAYLRGVFEAGRQTDEQYQVAIAYFEQAVKKQPDFADAYAVMAQIQLQFLFSGPLSPHEVIPKVEQAARKAIELDEANARAHAMLGTILESYYWKWGEGDREFRRARELRGGFQENLNSGVASLIRSGRFEEAIAEAKRVLELDPRSFDAPFNLGISYRAAGQFERAVAEIRRALALRPNSGRAHFQLGATVVLMGRPQDAIAELEAAVNSPPTVNPRYQAYLGYAYAATGRKRDARRILEALEARARQQYVSAFGLALIYDALGEKAPALAAFERAYQDHAVELTQAGFYPPFRTIAAEPLFIDRLRRIGPPR
jgi:tetratricopeptide (TPR) repeat protein